MIETALVVLVPEAEPVVATHRARYDPAAADGVPAHVTVPYPFRAAVDDDSASAVAAIAAAVPAFDVAFHATARFPDGVVLYLEPDPGGPFHDLIDRCTAAFPDCPPYGGAIAEPIPHLTVADGVDGATADALDAEVRVGLPVTTRVERLTLISSPPPWRIVRHFPLG